MTKATYLLIAGFLLTFCPAELIAQPPDFNFNNTCQESSSTLIAYGQINDGGALLPAGSFVAALDENDFTVIGVDEVETLDITGPGSYFQVPISEQTLNPNPPCGPNGNPTDSGIDGCGTPDGCERFTLVIYVPGTGGSTTDCYYALDLDNMPGLEFYDYTDSDGDITLSIDGFEVDFAGNSTVDFNIDGQMCFPTLADLITALPIELSGLSARAVNGKSQISWVTASEVNNAVFEIERSLDGRVFQQIGEVEGAGNSNATLQYEFWDQSPFSGVNYYRLKQIDFDGSSSFSQVVTVDFSTKDDIREITIFPNPIVTETITLGFEGDWASSETSDVRMYDLHGRLVAEWQDLATNSQTITLPKLASGVYQMVVEGGGEMLSERVVVR